MIVYHLVNIFVFLAVGVNTIPIGDTLYNENTQHTKRSIGYDKLKLLINFDKKMVMSLSRKNPRLVKYTKNKIEADDEYNNKVKIIMSFVDGKENYENASFTLFSPKDKNHGNFLCMNSKGVIYSDKIKTSSSIKKDCKFKYVNISTIDLSLFSIYNQHHNRIVCNKKNTRRLFGKKRRNSRHKHKKLNKRCKWLFIEKEKTDDDSTENVKKTTEKPTKRCSPLGHKSRGSCRRRNKIGKNYCINGRLICRVNKRRRKDKKKSKETEKSNTLLDRESKLNEELRDLLARKRTTTIGS